MFYLNFITLKYNFSVFFRLVILITYFQTTKIVYLWVFFLKIGD